MHHNFAEHLEI